VVVLLIARGLEYLQDQSDRSNAPVNLTQVLLAMHIYQDIYGHLPPAALYSKDGKPLLSWRVLILPFVEERSLYQRFKLDEPWDSPHNIQLLRFMPSLYAPPMGKASKVPIDHTVLQVFVGKGTAFESREGLRLPEDFPDGASDTLLVVEAGPPVPWTKPEELNYDPDGPLPDLRCLFSDGFLAACADRSIWFMKKNISERTLRAAITRNGANVIGPDWDRRIPGLLENNNQPGSPTSRNAPSSERTRDKQ
jgi:hypothetical protein